MPAFFRKIAGALPSPLAADTLYAIRTGVGFDLYISDSTGSIAHKVNDTIPSITRITSTQSSSIVTLGNITQLVSALAANSVYRVHAAITFQSAAATTGLNLGVMSPLNSRNELEISVPVVSASSSTALVKFTPNTTLTVSDNVVGTGVTAINSNHTALIRGFIHTGITAGNFQLMFASEVAASAITLQVGSSLIVEKIA